MKRGSIRILSVKVNTEITKKDVLNDIEKFISENGTHYICTVNPEFVMDAQKDSEFKKIINESDLAVSDGFGLLLAMNYLERVAKLSGNFLFPVKAFFVGILCGIESFIKGNDLGERITGADLLYDLCSLSAEKGYSVFFLGGWQRDSFGRKNLNTSGHVAEKTADELKRLNPNLKIVGAASDFTSHEKDDIETLNYIHECMLKNNVTHIDILFVAYGHSKQEKWIRRNINKIPARVGIGVGASFDFVICLQRRAPQKYISRNLEWLYRLFTQPWRIKRILKAFPIFPLTVFILSVKNRFK